VSVVGLCRCPGDEIESYNYHAPLIAVTSECSELGNLLIVASITPAQEPVLDGFGAYE
jgi:hypothetical protein